MTTVDRRHLTVGRMVAEGGEGRVYEMVGRPEVLFKAYRRSVPLDSIAPLLSWRQRLVRSDPAMGARVTAATAWPTEVVIDGAGGTGAAVGLVIPRAPRRFSVRHRDGAGHLATLSYLTADPRQRNAAYGLALPPAAAVERLALVYALARLLEAFVGGEATLTHGDLSTKNVLWSLQRGPEVYVIDCDGSRLFGPGGARAFEPTRRAQVATPNWDDPAAAAGADPGPLSDRYSLALIFLRVVGAAHYPIQARQKRGETLDIDVEIPIASRRGRTLLPARALLPAQGAARALDALAPVWDLCGRGLGVADPPGRPDASAWARALEAMLDDLGAGEAAARVRANQGDPRAAPPAGLAARHTPAGDVTVRPVPAQLRTEHWRPAGPRWAAPAPARSPGLTYPASSAMAAPAASVSQQARNGLRSAWRWWLLTHRRTARTLRARGRRRVGLRRLAFCAVTDFAGACVALFLVAMLVSPFLGI